MNPNSLVNNVNQANTSATTINTNNRENREGTAQNDNSGQSVQSAASSIANAYSGSLQAAELPNQFHQEAMQASEGEHADFITKLIQTDEQSAISSDENKSYGTSSDDDKKMPAKTESDEADDQKLSPFHAEAIIGTVSHDEAILSLIETDSKKSPSKNENSSKGESTTLTTTERLEKKDASRTESIPHVASLQTAPERKNSSSSSKSPKEKPIASAAATHESTIDRTHSLPELRRYQAPMTQPGAISVSGPGIPRSNSSTSSFSGATDNSNINPTSRELDNHPLIDRTDRNNLPIAAEVDETTMREGEDILTPYDPELPVSNAYIATRQTPQAPPSTSEPVDQAVDQHIDNNPIHRNNFQRFCTDPVNNCFRGILNFIFPPT